MNIPRLVGVSEKKSQFEAHEQKSITRETQTRESHPRATVEKSQGRGSQKPLPEDVPPRISGQDRITVPK